jgi:hypothetical protein
VLRNLILSACALALTACSTSSAAKARSCSGDSRRPVNIHGSVLPGSPIPAVTAPIPAPPVPGPNGKPAKTPTGALGVPAIVLKTPISSGARSARSPRKVSALAPAFPSCA